MLGPSTCRIGQLMGEKWNLAKGSWLGSAVSTPANRAPQYKHTTSCIHSMARGAIGWIGIAESVSLILFGT